MCNLYGTSYKLAALIADLTIIIMIPPILESLPGADAPCRRGETFGEGGNAKLIKHTVEPAVAFNIDIMLYHYYTASTPNFPPLLQAAGYCIHIHLL